MKANTQGMFNIVCKNPDGSVAWEESFSNGTTDQGRAFALNNVFRNVAASATWFVGLISATSYTALSPLDTAATHTGWVELADYTEATRRQWDPSAPVSSSGITTLTVASPLVFTASGSVTVKGAFLASASAKNSTAGVLWATGVFASDQVLIVGQTVSITYQTSLT